MDDSSFGARLRRQREQRGASLEAVSAATRISVRVLEAFENEQWYRLPGGFFNRGFLRSIARYLNIDENALIAAYVAATQDSPARAGRPPSAHLHKFWIAAAALFLAVVLAAGGWLVYRRVRPPSPRAMARPAPLAAPSATRRR